MAPVQTHCDLAIRQAEIELTDFGHMMPKTEQHFAPHCIGHILVCI